MKRPLGRNKEKIQGEDSDDRANDRFELAKRIGNDDDSKHIDHRLTAYADKVLYQK
jgi:hypothetical protein